MSKRSLVNRLVRLLLACSLLAVPLTVSGCEHALATGTQPGDLGRWALNQPEVATPSTATPVLLGESVIDTLPPALDDYPTASTPPLWSTDFSGIIDAVQTNTKVVALTFDDGPTQRTRRIIGELDAASAHATFFWVGSRITRDAAVYSIAHGEELANHTWSHPDMHRLTSEEASEQIGATSARIAEFTGSAPTWFRSPFNRLYAAELTQVQAHGLLYANYSTTSIDWMKNVSDARILGEINKTLRPGGVILMHDSANHDPTRYLPALLKHLTKLGYQMVTLTQLAKLGPPAVQPLVLGDKGLGFRDR
jgi:peptidoglycan/xylan/chitin deacetylase (PgdA/CDA1 family)